MSYQLSNNNNTKCFNSEVESNFYIFEIKVSYLNNDNVSLITQLQLNEYFGESL